MSDLEEWIDHELEFYVKDLINDYDYRQLRKNLIDIARAEARAQATRLQAPRSRSARTTNAIRKRLERSRS